MKGPTVNGKLKIALISASSFGIGVASTVGFIAWTLRSVAKEMNQRPTTAKRYSRMRDDQLQNENAK